MTIFHELPFVFRVISLIPGIVSSRNIVEKISPSRRYRLRRFWARFPMFLHGVSCLGTILAQTFLYFNVSVGWYNLSLLIRIFRAIFLLNSPIFYGSWHPFCICSRHESQKLVFLVCAHPRHSSHLHISFWHAGPTCGHFLHHTTIVMSCFHTPVNFDWSGTF
jgi:hypothetical protein